MVRDGSSEPTYDDWAPYWDAIDVDRGPMLTFYRSLIDERTASLIDLACGTGTMTIPLARELRQYHPFGRVGGIDRSPQMLRMAREHDATIDWVVGDMRAPPVAGLFDGAVCTFNVLQELQSDEDLYRAFAAVRRLLSPGGFYAFDIYQPNLEWLNAVHHDHLSRIGTDRQGRTLEVREDKHYDPASKIVTLDWRLHRTGRTREPPLARLRHRVRQFFPSDVERLLDAAGLAIRQRYGDFDKTSFAARSKKQILVCSPR